MGHECGKVVLAHKSNQRSPNTVTTDTELRQANIALAERVIKTCGNLRPRDVERDFAEDAVLALPYAPAGTPREIAGRTAIIDYISLLADYIPQGIFVDHRFDTLAKDPGHVIAWYAASTQLLTTGREYANTYVTEIEIRDGKVTRYTEYFDPINWLVAQGGEITAPPGG
jgi:uncharacterized protein